jgi:hypothetical protein
MFDPVKGVTGFTTTATAGPGPVVFVLHVRLTLLGVTVSTF